jgi:hypothetical protein
LVKQLKSESGYSLVEVMASIMILTIAIIPIVGMFDTGLKTAVLGGDYDGARALANQKMEEIKALPYNRPGGATDSVVEKYSPDAANVTGSSDIYSWSVDTDYVNEALETSTTEKSRMRVTVTVTWDGGSKSITTAGLVTGYEL